MRQSLKTMLLKLSILYVCLLKFIYGYDFSNLQCFENLKSGNETKKYTISTQKTSTIVNNCIKKCIDNYYRFVALNNENGCTCMNMYKGAEIPCTDKSTQNCAQIINDSYYAICETGVQVPGPPRHLRVVNRTNTTMKIEWEPPEYKYDITGYVIMARVLHTHASFMISPSQWKVYNDTTHYNMYNLQPGTTYNLTVQAQNENGLGALAFVVNKTLIGEPSPLPNLPAVYPIDDHRLHVTISKAQNDNGPVSAYQVIVINNRQHLGFTPEYLKSYAEAKKDGLPYYITAELTPEEIEDNFTVGDGKYYRNYYNAPLEDSANVDVLIGVVSRSESITTVAYSPLTGRKEGIIILNVASFNEDNMSINTILTTAIVFLALLLIVSIVLLIYLKRRIRRRQRPVDHQELTLHGPILELENRGYIHEDDEMERPNHYKNLRDKIWNIPQDFLDIRTGTILGFGKFGRVVAGSVQRGVDTVPVAIQVIPDRTLQKSESKSMIKQLNILVVLGSHKNLVSLIGFYENPNTLYIVFEHYDDILKNWLLNARKLNEDGSKFTPINENDLLDYFIQIARGMDYMFKKKLVHGQLCCRNVQINDQIKNCKITGIGLADFTENGVQFNYSRWQAHEIFRQRQPSSKSDVWSYGCLMWETCALGGTPFVKIPSTDIALSIIRGTKLHKLPYVSDELYQIMINCWQTDSDERPTFEEIIQNLEMLQQEDSPVLNFLIYPDFSYEKYSLEYEKM